MNLVTASRREFLKLAGTVAGARLVGSSFGLGQPDLLAGEKFESAEVKADYTLRIAASPIEIAQSRIVSGITYNGKFPGPFLRFKEGQPAIVDVFNDTDAPEQLHWHGQFLPTDVDGAAEERHTTHSSARDTKNQLHSAPLRFPVLSHAQSSGRRSTRGTVQRTGRSRLC